MDCESLKYETSNVQFVNMIWYMQDMYISVRFYVFFHVFATLKQSENSSSKMAMRMDMDVPQYVFGYELPAYQEGQILYHSYQNCTYTYF